MDKKMIYGVSDVCEYKYAYIYKLINCEGTFTLLWLLMGI